MSPQLPRTNAGSNSSSIESLIKAAVLVCIQREKTYRILYQNELLKELFMEDISNHSTSTVFNDRM